MRRFFLTFLVLFLFFSMAGNAVETEAARLTRKIDRLYQSPSSVSDIQMIITTPYWQKIAALKLWTKGRRKTFIRVLSPEREAGTATLRDGEAMWNYFPRINNVVKIPPSMMLGAWLGSDFTNNDLVKEMTYTRAYHGTLIYPKGRDKAFHYLQLTPKAETPTVWGKIIMKVKKSDEIPREISFFRSAGKKVKVMKLSEIKVINGRKVPTKIVLKPEGKDRSTILIYKKIRFNVPVAEKIFTFDNFTKGRR
ncbi:MAG: outer membrane lipoprotein-sorting protein [Alphaproteobacteria bacterium]